MIHCFDTGIAKEYGILEAVMINHFVFWISKNEANGVNFHDGSYWTYNSNTAFQKLFPYASKRQIERALQHLRDEGILKVGNYNAAKYDRTLWYAFTEKGKCISRFGEMESTEWGNGNHQTVTPIPDTDTVINTDTDTDNIPHTPKGEPEKSSWKDDPELSPDMISAVSDWLEYKKERKESYKPTGLKSLITQIKHNAKQFGEQPVIEVITSSMASGYKGICFDKLKSTGWNRQKPEPEKHEECRIGEWF